MTDLSDTAYLSGPLPAKLVNTVSDAIHDALARGMDTYEAACIVVAVAADYGRAAYGPDYCDALADVVRRRREVAPPP